MAQQTRVKRVEYDVDLAAGRVTMTAADGSGATLTAHVNELSAELQVMCSTHGLKQKLADSLANSGSVGDAVETWTMLKSGTWGGHGGGGGGPRDGELAEAIVTAELSKGTKESVLAKLKALRETENGATQIAAYRDDPRVKVAMANIAIDRARLRAKDAKADVANATTDFGALSD